MLGAAYLKPCTNKFRHKARTLQSLLAACVINTACAQGAHYTVYYEINGHQMRKQFPTGCNNNAFDIASHIPKIDQVHIHVLLRHRGPSDVWANTCCWQYTADRAFTVRQQKHDIRKNILGVYETQSNCVE